MSKRIASIPVVFLLVVLVLFAASCAETPQSVADEINSYNNSNEAERVHELVSLEEAVQSAGTSLQNRDQFIMEGLSVKLPLSGAKAASFELNHKTVDPVQTLKLIAAEQFNGLAPEAAAGAENSEITYRADNVLSYYSDGQNMIYVHGLSGAVRLLHGASLKYCDSSEGGTALSGWDPYEHFPAERIISLHSGENVEDTLAYELEDGAVRVLDAMQVAQNYLDRTLSKYEDGQFSYKIRKIYIRKISEDKYGYEFSAERYYGGIPIDSTPLYRYVGADIGSEGYFVENGDPIYIWMIDSGSIDYFRCEACRRVNNSCDDYETLLTLDSAFSILSEMLTDSAAFKVNSVELLYINGYYSDTYLNMFTEEDVDTYVNYPKKTRLVWAILLDIPSVKPGTLEYPHDPHFSFFVDAKTGEVIGYYDISAEYVY